MKLMEQLVWILYETTYVVYSHLIAIDARISFDIILTHNVIYSSVQSYSTWIKQHGLIVHNQLILLRHWCPLLLNAVAELMVTIFA